MVSKPQVVSFSGGRTSAYLVWLMEQQRKIQGWDVHYIYMDTGAEHPKTYEFIREVVKHFGIQLTVLRMTLLPMGKGVGYEVVPLQDVGCDLVPWARMLQKYSHPYIGGAFCTDRMKLKPFKKNTVKIISWSGTHG